jgi:hypothetical protein
MLCVECHRHFDLSFQDYTSIKEETISEIQGIYVDPAFLQFLQADLDAYRLSKCSGQLDACPWISPTVISKYLTEAERSTLPSYELETWDSPNHATYLRESAEKGCDMCLRMCEGIDWLGYEYEDISINSSLQLEPVTLRPVELIIEVSRDDFDPRYLRFGLLEENTTTGRHTSVLPFAFANRMFIQMDKFLAAALKVLKVSTFSIHSLLAYQNAQKNMYSVGTHLTLPTHLHA